MKKMALLIFLVGCMPPVETTHVLTEKAKVLQTCYNPGTHGTGVGFTSGGDVAFVSTTIQPKYAIVFECQHGRFIIEDEGKGSRAAKLWERLKEGQEVLVQYQEEYVKEDGKRKVVGYKFVDAR